jgi:P4 family phage/plasmid primase-like protien
MDLDITTDPDTGRKFDSLLRDPRKFTRLARAFMKERFASGRPYRYYDGQHYQYTGTRFEAVADEAVGFAVRSWLERKGCPVTNHLVGNILPNVKNKASVTAAPPTYLGAGDWPQADVIAFSNGLLDVGAGVLRDHTPHWFSTACLPFAYDPAATCPAWLRFLSQVMEEDAERVALLQEWFGCNLTEDTSLQKSMTLQGAARGGKGTILRVLEALVGAGSTPVVLESLADRFALLTLLEKTVATVSEVDFKGVKNRQQIINRLKAIVGEDRLPVEWKGINRITVTRLRARFTIACNDALGFLDPSGAVAARMLVVPFRRSFAGQEDTGLAAKLAAEYPGVVNWALDGLARLRGQGRFTEPAVCKAAQDERRRENTPALAFAEACLAVERRLVPNPGVLPGVALVDEPQSVWGEQLREAFEMWKAFEGLDGDYRWMVRDLTALVPALGRQRKDSPLAQPGKRHQDHLYTGIGLRDDRPVVNLGFRQLDP